nr:MAG TPA: hypothetical protein [Caudoviricetes sp.]
MVKTFIQVTVFLTVLHGACLQHVLFLCTLYHEIE